MKMKRTSFNTRLHGICEKDFWIIYIYTHYYQELKWKEKMIEILPLLALP